MTNNPSNKGDIAQSCPETEKNTTNYQFVTQRKPPKKRNTTGNEDHIKLQNRFYPLINETTVNNEATIANETYDNRNIENTTMYNKKRPEEKKKSKTYEQKTQLEKN